MRHPRLTAIGLVLLITLATGGGLIYLYGRPDRARLPIAAVSGPRPEITPPRIQSIPTISVAKVVGWPANTQPQATNGLQVALFADKLDHPRWLYTLPNGDVLVAESRAPAEKAPSGIIARIRSWVRAQFMARAGAGGVSPDRITLLRDADGDGVAEKRVPFITKGLKSPIGMALVGNRLFVANTDSVIAFPYNAGELNIAAAPERIVALPSGGEHWTRSLVASPDGLRLYVGVGSASNIGEGGMAAERNRAAILEINLATRYVRPYATGLRNPVGLAWEARSRTLWTVVNERDLLGSDVPPDYLADVRFGAFYGWPYTYWGGYEDPRVKPQRPDLLQYTRRPDYALGAHTASIGLAFGSLGPFRNGAFISQHGSWNRQPASGYQIVFVPFVDPGLPNGPIRSVLSGFLDGDGNARGRPAGLSFDARGALLVADDAGNRIWRITPR